MSGEAFAARFPVLFHVTELSALPGIRSRGLLSAAGLCGTLGVPLAHRPALLEENRKHWTRVVGQNGEIARLRRQGMSDAPLRARLGPELSPATWRRFINGLVFLFADEDAAWKLRRAKGEMEREQVVLAFGTRDLLDAGVEMAFCPFNNGYLDRRPRSRPRWRAESDYRSVSAYTPRDVVKEIIARGGIPPTVPFTERPSRPAQG